MKPLYKTVALCWLGWVFDFYDLILIAFLIPAVDASFHVTMDTGAWLIGSGLAASGIGGILFGWLADQRGRKPVLMMTVLLYSAGMMLTSQAHDTTQFLGARFLTGLGLGGEWAVGHALIAESVPAETRARWSAFLQSGEPVGVALASIVGFMAAPVLGWRMVFLLSGLTGFLALMFRRYLSESPMWQQRTVVSTKQRLSELRAFFPQYGPLMLLAFILAVLKLGTYWTCYTWLPRFISQSFGKAVGQSVLWMLLGQLGQFIGMYLFGYTADRLGRRVAFTAFSLLTACALLPMALYWQTLFQDYPALFWLCIFTMGIGSGCTAGFGALLAEIFPTDQRTLAMGMVYNLGRGVQLFAPVVVAMAVNHDGLRGGLLVPVTLAVLTAGWVWTLPERTGRPLFHEHVPTA